MVPPLPVISYKFRHWGYFEGPYKGHSPTGEMVDFYGMGILKRAEDVEIYYDPADLISKLLKGPLIPEQQNVSTIASPAIMGSCPFKKPE
ncbi:pathogen-related protein [Tanacetum coccineum]